MPGLGAFEPMPGLGAFEPMPGLGAFELMPGLGAFEPMPGKKRLGMCLPEAASDLSPAPLITFCYFSAANTQLGRFNNPAYSNLCTDYI